MNCSVLCRSYSIRILLLIAMDTREVRGEPAVVGEISSMTREGYMWASGGLSEQGVFPA